MALTMKELDRGVKAWQARTGWPQDFHNQFYARLDEENPQGAFTDAWWTTFLPHLQRWVATRGKSHDYLTANAHAALPSLSAAWRTSVAPFVRSDVTDVSWEQVVGMPTAVAPIKGVKSPVFTSKFCHFLAPALFPVIDQAALGGASSYERHFRRVQQQWAETTPGIQTEMTERLQQLIDAPLARNYPRVNKVVELCLMGRGAA